MASDIMGRRQIMQQRLDRVRDLELAIREQVAIIAESAGMTVEQLDFDGSFRASLASLASLAARRPTFDVVLALPTAPAGVRIQQLHNQVRVQVIAHEDGPYRPAAPPQAPASMTMPASSTPASPAAPVAPVGPAPAGAGKPVVSRPVPSSPASPGMYDTAPVSITQIAAATTLPPSPPPPPDEAEPGDLVASDLAALLWEGLSDPQYDERV